VQKAISSRWLQAVMRPGAERRETAAAEDFVFPDYG